MISKQQEPVPASGVSNDQSRGDRPFVRPDPLYGSVRVAAWAALLLATAPFRRLTEVSLSDVPGSWLFGAAFPSRLDHTLGVYYLTRLARPRDRALQAAALAHDLGHAPFSHLSEPLMRTFIGCDHEERAARQLGAIRASLSGTALRRLGWLDWDEVAQLVLGHSAGNHGALLNGQLDYDNIDHVARFQLAAGLGQPGYNPLELARGLRLLPPDDQAMPPADSPRQPVYLIPQDRASMLAWQTSRRSVYGFLHHEHRNLAPHAMLRRTIEMAALFDVLSPDFFDLTDADAIAHLCALPQRDVATLARSVLAGAAFWHTCQWEAELPVGSPAISHLLDTWQTRAALEFDLASEAGLAPHEVALTVQVSGAERHLPPISTSGRPDSFTWLPSAPPAPAYIHLFASPDAARDYRHRLRTAAERRLGSMGAVPIATLAPETAGE